MNMKKGIAILLVVLVAGVMFGADATLTLGSTVAGVLKHGFVSEEIETVNFGHINTALSGADLNNNYTGIDLYDDGQDVGYYYFAANTAKTGYKVSFVVNPFASATADFEVPYTLVLADEGKSPNVTLTTTDILTPGTLGGDISPSTPVDVIATPSNAVGPKYAGLALSIVIAGDANLAYGIPAAEDYAATIVATVTTH